MKKIFAVILVALLMGCAGTQVKSEEPFDLEGWAVIADIELAEWNKLSVEGQADLVVQIVGLYRSLMSCYEIEVALVGDEKKVYILVKCISRFTDRKDEVRI